MLRQLSQSLCLPGPRRRTGVVVAGFMLALLALTLAGCGQATLGSQPPSGNATSGHPIGGTSIRPCSGPLVSAASVGTVARVLTEAQSGQMVSAHAGELIQVQLPMTFHWSFNDQAGNLAVVPPADGQDPTLNVCFWTFKAQSAGSVTLRFSGAPLCDPPAQQCSQLLIAANFTVNVG
jgi:hypothetical protein